MQGGWIYWGRDLLSDRLRRVRFGGETCIYVFSIRHFVTNYRISLAT